MFTEPSAVMQAADAMRRAQGFLTVHEVLALIDRGNVVYDPFSVLIGSRVRVGSGNIFYPCVQLEGREPGELVVGDGNIFFPNTRVVADPGVVTIGDGNQFGEGGCVIKANRPGARIEIGNKGRFTAGVWVLGKTTLGNGSQVIGQVYVENCELAAGESHTHEDPACRGAVLKGFGQARGLRVRQGFVITSDNSQFHQSAEHPQAHFHPEKKP